MADGDVVYKVRADNSGLEQDIKNAESVMISAAGTVEKAVVGSAKALGKGVAAVTAGTAAIGVAATGSSDRIDRAVDKIIAATNASADSAEKLDRVVREVYSDNFGENFDDIADCISKITQNLGEMNETNLVNVTESAYALLDVFEMGVDESSRAAKAMMQNFNISAAQAYDFIAKGAQNGLNYSGELLDSISEYSVQFAKMGLDADDMFNIFAAGAESGAWNLDKIGDAVKEMSIRVIDGSDSTAEGFEKIGLNADVMSAKFAQGGDIARKAFSETLKALSELDDPLAQDAAGVAILGTMWEDLGADAVSALADISDSAYDCAGAMDSIKDVNYSSLSDALEGLKRQAEMLIEPLGASLIPLVEGVIDRLSVIADEITPQLISAAEPLIEALLEIVEPVSQLVSELLPPLIEIVSDIVEDISAMIVRYLPELTSAIKGALGFVMDVVRTAWECRDAIAAVTVAVGAFVVAIKIGNAVSAAVNAIRTFKTATDAATASQLAMNAAGAANPYVLIGAAAAAAVGGIATFVSTAETATEAADELRQKSDELIRSAKQSSEAAKAVKELTDEYKELNECADTSAEARERLEQIQDTLISTYGLEAEKLDLVNGKYEEQIVLLEETARKKRELSIEEMKSAYLSATQAQASEYAFDIKANASYLRNEVQDLIIETAKQYGVSASSGILWNADQLTFAAGSTYEQRYNILSSVIKQLDDAYGDNIDADIYNTLLTQRDKMKSEWEKLEYITKEYNALSDPLSQYKNTYGNGVIYHSTAEEMAARGKANLKEQQTTLDYTPADSYSPVKTYSPAASTSGYSGGTSSGNSGNFISISSYIPTVWSGGDHSELLNSLIGSDLMGDSAAAHSIDALTSGEITSSGSSASGETDLADVVNAITKLQRKVEALDMNLEIELKARDLTIGKVAVKDINDLAKQSGKSPFTF